MTQCHPEVYQASILAPLALRPWLMWCKNHEPAPEKGDSCRGVLAHCPTWREAVDLAIAHATYNRLATKDGA